MTRAWAATAYGMVSDLQHVVDGVLIDHGVRFAERRTDDGILIRSVDSAGGPAPLPLRVAGDVAGRLDVRYKLSVVNRTAELEIVSSQFILTAEGERDPLARLEYDPSQRTPHTAHWHVHAERGAFSSLLTKAAVAGQRTRDPARLSTLHFPLGGTHFRPPLEDVLTFLVDECGVDAALGWRPIVGRARSRWLRAEAQRVTRDMPVAAVEQLRAMGWRITPPSSSRPADGP